MNSDHIIENGQDAYKKTPHFLRKEKEIRQEIDLKYKSMLTAEQSLLKRAKLRFQKEMELRKALAELHSKEILFLRES